MNEFVEQCRKEWKRLGVPEPLAEEMATELTADIREAESDGISIEELLGSSVSDPLAFAASWATERGIVTVRSARASSRRGRPALVAFTGVAALASIVAALLLVTGEPKVGLVASGAKRPNFLTGAASFVPPPSHVQASAAAPIEWMLLCLAIIALGFSAWLWSKSGRSRVPMASVR
jgi:hypothetical protein